MIFQSLGLLAQSFDYKKYTTNDGLPSDEVYYIMQDSKGYMWFATDNGVSRYDGYSFKNYSTKNGLLENLVFSIYEDYKGRIWFISHPSHLCYLEGDSIYPCSKLDIISKHIPKTVRILNNTFSIDTLGTIYFGTYNMGRVELRINGDCIINRNENKITISENPFLVSGDGRIDSIEIFGIDTLSFPTLQTNLFYIYSAKTAEGRTILSYDNSILELNKYRKVSIHKKSKERNVWMGITSDNSIWLSHTNKGVRQYKASLQKEPIRYSDFENCTVTNVFFDNANNLWISSFTGLFYLPSNSMFTLNHANVKNKSVHRLAKGKGGDVWFSTYNNKIFKYSNQELLEYDVGRDNIVLSILYSEMHDKLYYGGWELFGEINEDKPKNIRLIEKLSLREDMRKFHIHKMSQKENGDLIYSGLRIGFIEPNAHLLDRRDKIQVSASVTDECKSFVNFKGYTYICAEYGGVWKYDFKNMVRVLPQNDLLDTKFTDIVADDDKIWLASKGKGAICLIGDSVYQFSEADGLSSNSVNTIAIDKNVVWIGTMDGLNKITFVDIKNKDYTIEKIHKAHGLASNVINDILFYNDTLYVGTDRGLSYFNINNFELNFEAPPIYISNVSIQEKDTLVRDKYELTYNQNNIAIQYLGINYRTGSKTKYKYRLVGADNNWIETRGRIVRYSSLKPGAYKFEVVAQNENGVWGTKPATVSIIIDAPYWETWWFVLFVILLIVGMTTLVLRIIFRVKLYESKKRNLLHNNLNKLKQEALAQQMNPHFIFNTLSSIQYFINENDKSASNKYLTMFSNLMRMTLNNSHKKNITIKDEFAALEIYIQLEQLRFPDKFEYQIEIDSGINIEKNLMPALMLQPFVENSIWHGIMHKKTNNGMIKIFLRNKNGFLEFRIQDNGIGRKKAAELNNKYRKNHKSLGSKITESRLRLISALYDDSLSIEYTDMQNKNEHDCGTEVTITLPILAPAIQE